MKLSGSFAVLATIALGALGLVLYSRSNQVDFPENDHFERKLGELQMHDSLLNQNLLKVRYRLLGDYDSLGTELTALKQTMADLATVPSFLSDVESETIRTRLEAFAQLLAVKEAAVENFKSENAVLNNSLRYLPHASTELLGRLATDATDRKIEESVAHLMQQVLVYCLESGENGAPAVRKSLESLSRWRVDHTAHSSAAFLNRVVAHASSILSRKPKVEALTERIVSIPTARAATDLFQQYERQLTKALRRSELLRAALEVLCALLLPAIGYTIYALDAAKRGLERRVAERTAALRETNERFEVVTAATTNIIWDWDLASKTVWWNGNFESVFGYSPEIAGSGTASWTDRIHPDDVAATLTSIRAVVAGSDRDWSAEYRFRRHDGTYAMVFDRGAVLRDAAGQPLRMIGAMQDITERAEAEAALRESERHYRDLIHALPAAVYTCDAEGRVTLYNEAAAQLWGRVPVLGKDLWCGSWKIFDTHGRPLALESCPMAVTIREERVVRGQEIVIERPDGTRAFVLPYPSLIRDAAGKLVGAINMLVDLTDRRQAERDLEQLNRQLLEASRQAGMAEVATGVLHNVGNVLNSVNVSATLVTDAARKSKATNLARVVALLDRHSGDLGGFLNNDPQGRNLPVYLRELSERLIAEQAGILRETESLRQNIEHIKEIVSMQQDYAKVSGVTEMLNVTDLVEDSLRLNSAALARHEVTVERDFHDVPSIVIEKHKALQILVNLIRNAKHACDGIPSAEKRVTIRVANGQGRIKISVADTGVGIPPENLTRIFNHGFTTRKNGHGFGLHSGALAARDLGGSLSAHSDGPGRGATFTLELPANTSAS